jgi:hypothetical protein
MGKELKLRPQPHGQFRLPPEYEHLSGASHDSLILELIKQLETLNDRVEELETWLPVPPDEEED